MSVISFLEKYPENAEIYSANLASYKEKLSALDTKFTETVARGATDTLLFGDRFPFLYMAEDYGLNYYAAFSGCSAETEASFETIVYLAGKVNELGLKSICTLENSDQKIAQTIRDNTDNIVYLGGNDLETADQIARRINKPVDEVLYLPIGQEYLFRRGQRPLQLQRYQIYNDPLYQQEIAPREVMFRK